MLAEGTDATHLGRTRPSWAFSHGLKHGVAVDVGIGVGDAVVRSVTVLDWQGARWLLAVESSRRGVSEMQRAGQDPSPLPGSSSFPLLALALADVRSTCSDALLPDAPRQLGAARAGGRDPDALVTASEYKAAILPLVRVNCAGPGERKSHSGGAELEGVR